MNNTPRILNLSRSIKKLGILNVFLFGMVTGIVIYKEVKK